MLGMLLGFVVDDDDYEYDGDYYEDDNNRSKLKYTLSLTVGMEVYHMKGFKI